MNLCTSAAWHSDCTTSVLYTVNLIPTSLFIQINIKIELFSLFFLMKVIRLLQLSIFSLLLVFYVFRDKEYTVLMV